MPHLNDLKKSAFKAALVTTSENIDDLEREWLLSKGATSDQVNDAWMEVFLLTGETSALTGTVTVTAGTAAVVGVGTLFTTELSVGDSIKIGTEVHTVSAITDDLNLTLATNHVAGAAGAAVALVIDKQYNDAAYAYLGGLGHTGAINDRWFKFYSGALP